MSTPTGHNAFLHELEIDVRAELTLAGTSTPEEEAVAVPIEEWLFDPADAQRDQVGLRDLLGAVEVIEEALEGGPRLGDLPAPMRPPESGPAAG
jgi:hypothetical protein